MPRWLANLIGNSFRAEDTKSAIENLKLWGVSMKRQSSGV